MGRISVHDNITFLSSEPDIKFQSSVTDITFLFSVPDLPFLSSVRNGAGDMNNMSSVVWGDGTVTAVTMTVLAAAEMRVSWVLSLDLRKPFIRRCENFKNTSEK